MLTTKPNGQNGNGSNGAKTAAATPFDDGCIVKEFPENPYGFSRLEIRTAAGQSTACALQGDNEVLSAPLGGGSARQPLSSDFRRLDLSFELKGPGNWEATFKVIPFAGGEIRLVVNNDDELPPPPAAESERQEAAADEMGKEMEECPLPRSY